MATVDISLRSIYKLEGGSVISMTTAMGEHSFLLFEHRLSKRTMPVTDSVSSLKQETILGGNLHLDGRVNPLS
ncbi:MAG: hypothetical protein HYR67_02645 [Bacteroidetes bacterium]|nr:hypothetical protein [Bacteroidota bacterium]